MAKYDTDKEILICDCGHETRNYFYSDLKEVAEMEDSTIAEIQKIECENCKSEYEVTLEVVIEVSIKKNNVSLITQRSKYRNELDISIFGLPQYDDDIELEDGDYYTRDKIYTILNKKVIGIFSHSDEKQQTLQLNQYLDRQPRKEFEYDNGYGITTDIYFLPIGTKFYVNNGFWKGEIIEIDGEKHIRYGVGEGRTEKLDYYNDYNLSIEILD